MKLIFAQGNPGSDFSNSRHNLGFSAVDYFAASHGFPKFNHKSKLQAEISEASINGEKVILAKPTTFYNQTGQSAQAIINFYKLTIEDMIVIHDELSLNLGTIRIRNTGTDAGNKGVRSLNHHIGPNFFRLRIGINITTNTTESAKFVLSKFNSEQSQLITNKILPQTNNLIIDFINNRLAETSYNLLPAQSESTEN